MKKSHTLILLGLLLVALIGTSIYLTKRPPKEDVPAEVNEGKIALSQHDREDAVKMILESKGNTLLFERGEDGWIVNGDSSITLDESSVKDLEYSFSNMYSEQIVEENPQDLDKYGLQKPLAIATVILKDGTEKVFYVGNQTPAKNTYYLMVKEDPKVYTVWMNHGNHFTASLEDFRDRSLPNVDTQQLSYFKLERQEQPTIEIALNEEESEAKAYGVGIWNMLQPYRQIHTINTEEFSKQLEKIPSFKVQDFIEDYPQDLKKYGLDQPSMILQMKDMEEGEVHLLFGNEYDNDNLYFKLADRPAVYGMKKSSLEILYTLEPFAVVDKFAYIVNIDFVDQIQIQTKDKDYSIQLKREIKKAQEEGKEDETITTYFINNKEVEEKPFKELYQSLIGIMVDAENKETLEESPEVSMAFTLNVDPKQVVVDYVPYNRDFYAVFRDGTSEFLASKGQVTKILTRLEELSK
ncbi:MAG: DUF4340 domain-containing protein [Epulopiscium sp.]|nr:DUF4340 domain-containing protein [Candidatus Epulonipiscium sp.]